jgi:transposase
VQYLGIDVHSSASVWCLLDENGNRVARGRAATTYPALSTLAFELLQKGPLVAGHEVGTQVFLVHDAFTSAGVEIQAFNAAHLRMIAASRKKTDTRDAYWIARALQTGMKPHPVFIPTGEVRELRIVLAQREAVLGDIKSWQYRARAQLRARGVVIPAGRTKIQREVDRLLEDPKGVETVLLQSLGLCERTMSLFAEEQARLEQDLERRVEHNEVVKRLQTIPGIGKLVSVCFYATVGDITRFANARALTSYLGLVPSIRQTGEVTQLGHISKEGPPSLRRMLVQAAHVVANSKRADTEPLRAIFRRIQTNRNRRKIATVALARHLAKIAYRVWRDGTPYDPQRVRCSDA